MKNVILILILFTTSLNAQIGFEKGYFIDNNNTKTECYIKNFDWSSSPAQILYKSDLDSKVKTESSTNLKEFYIYNTEHFYKKFNVAVDENALSNEDSQLRELKFKNSVEFLRVLVNGKASLYELRRSNIFLYNVDGGKVKQLAYKKYISEDRMRKENNDFQQDIFENLKCESLTIKKLLAVNYKRDELIGLFKDYNECQNADYNVINKYKTPLVFNYNVTLGINSTALESEYNINSGFEGSSKFDNQTIFVPGFELEILLPISKNKWAVFAGLNYQNYKNSTEFVNFFDQDIGTISFEYSYLEIPLGIRRYMYLNPDLKLFLSASYGLIVHLSSNNEDVYEQEPSMTGDVEFGGQSNSNTALSLGVGLNLNSRYSLGLNYYISKQINNNANFSNNMDGAISLIGSYTIF